MTNEEVLGLIVGWAAVTVIIISALFFVYRKRKLLSEEIRLAIEKGQPFEIPQPRVNYYLHGILWTILGVSIFISSIVATHSFGIFSILALLPTAVGVAFLAYYKKVEREMKETQS